MCLHQYQVLSQRPASLRVQHRILAIPSIILFWIESSDVVPRICWSHSPNLDVTVPSAPTTSASTFIMTCWFISLARHSYTAVSFYSKKGSNMSRPGVVKLFMFLILCWMSATMMVTGSCSERLLWFALRSCSTLY